MTHATVYITSHISNYPIWADYFV